MSSPPCRWLGKVAECPVEAIEIDTSRLMWSSMDRPVGSTCESASVALATERILVNRLEQSRFAQEQFDSDCLNLHTTPGVARRPLVLLVPGLGGHGYETWGCLPSRMFEGLDGDPVDIALYNYLSGPRRLLRQAGGPEYWECQLNGHIRDLEALYDDIFLVGHSMGGLLVESVAMRHLQDRAQRQQGGAGAIAGLVLVASPRAGSGWASMMAKVPMIGKRICEYPVLRPLSSRSMIVDTYFSTYIERLNIANTNPSRVVLPVYAAIGGSDRLVNVFSSAFGVPERQRRFLGVGHIAIAKGGDPALARWLHSEVIDRRLEVRAQEAREARHASRRESANAYSCRPVVVARFVSDLSGLAWEEAYREVLQEESGVDVLSSDVRSDGGVPVDLYIAAVDTRHVLSGEPRIRVGVLDVCNEVSRGGAAVVAICPVGERGGDARAEVNRWLSDYRLNGSIFVETAKGVGEFRDVVGRLFRLVGGRRPQLAQPSPAIDRRLGDEKGHRDMKGGRL